MRNRIIAALALILGGSALLTGCSSLDGVLHKQSTNTFEDVDAFRADASVDVPWMPEDATAITLRTSTLKDAADAVVLLSSAASLPGECVEVARTSAPAWDLEGSPSPYEAATVSVCGEWSVIPAEDGWFGWTPNSEDEQRAALS